jgi:hypothetical protein
MDAECFLAIEARNGVRLELLSKSTDTRNLYAKVLNLLMEEKSKNSGGTSFMEDNCILTKYCEDLNQLRKVRFWINIKK